MSLFAAKILVGFFVGTLIGLTGLGGGVLLLIYWALNLPMLGQEMQWVTREGLRTLTLPPADDELVRILVENGSSPRTR